MKVQFFTLLSVFIWSVSIRCYAQDVIDGEPIKQSKMEYIYSLEDAQRMAYQKRKLIFFNCYAGWAAPCKIMDHAVFSNQEFADYMNKKFVNLFIDMQSKNGKELAKVYNVESYATYLILNYKGEVIHRISGGTMLPEFKKRVDMALKNETSLTGARKKYESGKYTKKDVYNYLNALNIAGEDSLFRKVGKEYMAMLTDKELCDKKHILLLHLNKDRQGHFYRYLIGNKDIFVKEMGEKAVNHYIAHLFASEVLSCATGDAEYNAERMDKLYKEMQEAALPDTNIVAVVYNIAKLRGERKYHELLQYMDEAEPYFSQQRSVRPIIEKSFNFKELNENEKQELVAYLQKAAKREKGSYGRQLEQLAKSVMEGEKGIIFEHASFKDLLARAEREKKLVFVDCYTSWCGPCRNMANNVFPNLKVGSYFNSNFINAKINMEEGEGLVLAKKYKVNVFPTLLFLNKDGEVVKSLIGYKSADQLLNAVKELQIK